jgi:hypothetical protein
MENLAASRPAPGADPATGYPVTSFGTALHLSQTNTWNGFQALTSWTQPFTGFGNVTNGTAADGIRFAFETYGSTYGELYVSDTDNPAFQPALAEWHQRLTAPAPKLLVSVTNPGTQLHLAWNRASPLTTIELKSNVTGAFTYLLTVTNRLEYDVAISPMANGQVFFRLRQPD